MLTHKGTQPIHTARLTLRRLQPEDAQQMYDNWASDERVCRYLTWAPHESPDATQQLLKLWSEAYERPDTYNWGIECDGRLIGNISVVRCDETAGWVELGYCMGSRYWGRGIMTEAAGAVIDYLFRQVGCSSIRIAHAVQNPASGRVAQKCGLTCEGTKRQYYKGKTGELLDIAEYSILRSEWRPQA